MECRDHCFCISCFVKSMVPITPVSEDAVDTAAESAQEEPKNGKKASTKQSSKITFVNPGNKHRSSHRMLLLDHECDQCNSLIIGKRVNCKVCRDFDLCLSCHRDIRLNSLKPVLGHKSDHEVF